MDPFEKQNNKQTTQISPTPKIIIALQLTPCKGTQEALQVSICKLQSQLQIASTYHSPVYSFLHCFAMLQAVQVFEEDV